MLTIINPTCTMLADLTIGGKLDTNAVLTRGLTPALCVNEGK